MQVRNATRTPSGPARITPRPGINGHGRSEPCPLCSNQVRSPGGGSVGCHTSLREPGPSYGVAQMAGVAVQTQLRTRDCNWGTDSRTCPAMTASQHQP